MKKYVCAYIDDKRTLTPIKPYRYIIEDKRQTQLTVDVAVIITDRKYRRTRYARHSSIVASCTERIVDVRVSGFCIFVVNDVRFVYLRTRTRRWKMDEFRRRNEKFDRFNDVAQ